MVFANGCGGQRVELWLAFASYPVVTAVERPDVEEGDNEEVKGVEFGLAYRKPTVAVAGAGSFDSQVTVSPSRRRAFPGDQA